MALDENAVFQDRYKIIRQLIGYPFFSIYEAEDLTYKKKYFIVEYDRNSLSIFFLREVDLWGSEWGSISPPIQEQWKIEGRVYLAVQEFSAVSIVDLPKISASGLDEKEVFHLIPSLLLLFKSLNTLKVAFDDIQNLADRILYFPEGKMLIAPVFFTVLNKKNTNSRIEFLKKSVLRIPEQTHVKALGEILCYLLTRSFSDNGSLPIKAKRILSSEVFEFLQNCVLGKIDSFELFGNCVTLLEDIRGENQKKQALLAYQFGASSSISSEIDKKKSQTKKTDFTARETPSFPIRFRRRMRKIAAYLNTPQNVPSANIVLFFRSLSALLENGLPLITALEVLENQEENKKFKGIIFDLRKKLAEGKSFSRAMELHPEIFTKLHIGMSQAGEEGGQLAFTVRLIAEYEERNRNYWMKFRAALVYPAFILLGSFIVVLAMCYVVLPSFSKIFAGLHLTLPLPTRILMSFANHITLILFIILGLSAVIYGTLKQYMKTFIGKMYMDYVKYAVPVVGRCWKSVNLIHFFNVFLVLIKVGVPFLQALKFYCEMAVSPVMGQFIKDFSENLSSGDTIRIALSEANKEHNDFFPKIGLDLFSTIQETGSIQEVVSSLIQYYERELDFVMGKTLDLLEPLVVCLLGGAVGFILIAVFLPIYSVVMNMK
ncbi:MAG: type II secretion system F family protein [Firmicutes bacterium]|nr:type II secretion system F family protein [Bacillota bacterium]